MTKAGIDQCDAYLGVHSGVALIPDPRVGVRIVGEWRFQNTETEED